MKRARMPWPKHCMRRWLWSFITKPSIFESWNIANPKMKSLPISVGYTNHRSHSTIGWFASHMHGLQKYNTMLCLPSAALFQLNHTVHASSLRGVSGHLFMYGICPRLRNDGVGLEVVGDGVSDCCDYCLMNQLIVLLINSSLLFVRWKLYYCFHNKRSVSTWNLKP